MSMTVNLMATVCAIFDNYCTSTCRARPLLDINMAFDEEDMDYVQFFEAWKLPQKVKTSVRSALVFQFPFAGRVAMESTSMV